MEEMIAYLVFIPTKITYYHILPFFYIKFIIFLHGWWNHIKLDIRRIENSSLIYFEYVMWFWLKSKLKNASSNHFIYEKSILCMNVHDLNECIQFCMETIQIFFIKIEILKLKLIVLCHNLFHCNTRVNDMLDLELLHVISKLNIRRTGSSLPMGLMHWNAIDGTFTTD